VADMKIAAAQLNITSSFIIQPSFYIILDPMTNLAVFVLPVHLLTLITLFRLSSAIIRTSE